MIVCPTIDTPDGAAWRCAPGTVALRCDCGTTDLIAIAPGGEPCETDGIERGGPMGCWCSACWTRDFGAESLV